MLARLRLLGGGPLGFTVLGSGVFALGETSCSSLVCLRLFKAFAVDDSGVVGIGLSGFWIHGLGGYTTKHMEFFGMNFGP